MKKNYLYLGTILAAAMCSCTNLDVDIKSIYTEYPNNEIAQEAKASDCYFAFRNQLANLYGYNGLMTLSSDEQMGVSFDGDYYDSGSNQHASLHNSLPGDNNLNWFEDAASGITKCNQALMDLGDELTKTTAQIRAARAYYHWLITDAFGSAPLLDRLYGDDEAVERTPRAEVVQWIVNELLEVKDALPTEVNAANYGKPTRWMADALLAKIYINWAVYTNDIVSYTPAASNAKLNDCVAVIDDIIASGKFDLSDDYKKRFLPENGSHIKDFIYAMPYTASLKDGNVMGRYRTWRRGQNDGNGGAGLYGAPLVNSVGGCLAMNPEFADLFCLEGDRRNDCIYFGAVTQFDPNTYEKTTVPNTYKGEQAVLTKTVTLKPITNESGTVIPLGPAYETLNTGANMTGWTQGWRTCKFIPNVNEYNTFSRNQSNDVPIFRYADMLLLKAEAILRGATATRGDSPMSLVNEIRKSVNAPQLTADPTLDELLAERGRELFDEGWRRNDLIRYGHFEDDWGFKNVINPGAKTEKFRRIFPVPTVVMDKNTNWKQNDGYK